ncbi:MAG: hypothetical protein JWN18_668 [Parcubacteria group bacterium]|nr:hypothetical protein [Parcubacteria group bacterium]
MIKYLIAVILVVGLGYGLIEAWPLIAGPRLAISSPINLALDEDGIVTIGGSVTRAAELTVDGSAVLRDQNGDFSSTLTFPRGGTILTFVARDRFGRTVTARRTIFVP